MRRELVFTAHPGRADLARPISLAEAGLKERTDLQEWIRAHPQILGAGVRIVTYEFDRWVSGAGTHADRLDLLGLGEDGRLVLAELKRDAAPDTVEMQAIKYAVFASKFSPETLAACHGAYLRRTLPEPVSDDDALAQLNEHCGGLDPDLLASPRIVLVAGSYPEPVTATVVWLCSQGLDITLIEIGAYQCATDLVITVSQLWPLPELDDFTVSPVAPAAKGSTGGSLRTRSTTNAVAALAEAGALADGTELHLVPAGRHAEAVGNWVAELGDRGRAIWRTGEKVRALEWPIDSTLYSASGLAEKIILEATGEQAAIVGPEWWSLEDGTTLAELAGNASGAKRDWAPLHDLLPLVHEGEWTTYGDLADAIGSHPIAVGQHLTKCNECQFGWRVLGRDGRPRPNFAWVDPTETRTCRQRLEDEGLAFSSGGSASPEARVSAEQLRSRRRTSSPSRPATSLSPPEAG